MHSSNANGKLIMSMEFIDLIQTVLTDIKTYAQAQIFKAANACAASIQAGRAVLLFGAGHSALPAQEAFPRIGSIPGFVQITEPALGFNGFVTGKGGQKQMSFLEGTTGFAAAILSNYDLTPADTLIVFSNSGINALPVELCWLAKDQGLTTISVGSTAHSLANQPKNPLGKRLLEVADIHIDNHIPVGDMLVTLEEGTRTGGGSTIAGMVIMNTIVVETIRALRSAGVDCPVYPSHNVSDDLQAVQVQEEALFKAYKELIAKL
jgi:uncharacterized phosphosugar-binding protein